MSTLKGHHCAHRVRKGRGKPADPIRALLRDVKISETAGVSQPTFHQKWRYGGTDKDFSKTVTLDISTAVFGPMGSRPEDPKWRVHDGLRRLKGF